MTKYERIIADVDFDGLVSAFFLSQIFPDIKEITFITPWKMNQGFKTTNKDIIADLPEPKEYGLWFDHHNNGKKTRDKVKGKFDPQSKSASRLIYDLYKHKLDNFEEWAIAADKIDSAEFDPQDFLHPDPASIISISLLTRNYQRDELLKYFLIEMMKTISIKELAMHKVVQDGFKYKLELLEEAKKMMGGRVEIIEKNGIKIMVINLIGLVDKVPKSIIYHMYLDNKDVIACVKIASTNWKNDKNKMTIGVSENPFNHRSTNRVNIGALMKKFGGGGSSSLGKCKIHEKDKDRVVTEIIDILTLIN